MKFAMTKTAAAMIMTAFSTAASAVGGIGGITEISITGGDFSMGAPLPAACNTATAFSSFQCVAAGTANPIDADDNLFEGPTLTAFNFFNAPVTTFTAATAAGAANSTSGNPLEGVTTATTITVDLGSYYANWSSSNFLQAPSHAAPGATTTAPAGIADSPLVTGTYNSVTGAFDISWSSYISTAPFANQTGYWHLTGVAAAVPEASTYGMMLAGLGLVGGMVVRRRKFMA